MKRILLSLIGAAALVAAPWTVSSAETSASADVLTPPDAAWGLVFDPGKVRTSALAGHVMDHFDEGQRAQLDDLIDGLSNTLGLNLRRDLGAIVAFGDSFAPADIAVAVDVGPNATNLEGLFLANAGYSSYDYGDLIIHSLQDTPEDPRLYCAVLPGDSSTPGTFLLSPNQSRTEQLVDAAKAGAKVTHKTALIGEQFVRVWIDRIPDDLFAGQTRQSNIAGMIRSLEVVGTTGETDTTVALNITLTNPARARQIYQMVAGGKALLEMAAESDPDAAKLADLLAYVRIDQPPQESSRLTITAMADTEGLAAVLDMLDEAGAFDDLNLD